MARTESAATHRMNAQGAAVAARIVDQLLDAVALAYGLAHGAALAARLDTARVLLYVCTLLAATYAALAVADARAAARAARGQGRRGTALLGALAALATVVQHYATYVFACVLRARIGSLFGQNALSARVFVAPLLVAMLGASVASLLDRYGVAPSIGGMHTPLSFADRFVEALAFTFGVGSDATRGTFFTTALFLALIVLVCAVARRHVAAWPRHPMHVAATFVLYVVSFVEQYALYAVARLIYASAMVRAGTLEHGAPLDHWRAGALVDDAALLLLVVLTVAVAALVDALLAGEASATLGQEPALGAAHASPPVPAGGGAIPPGGATLPTLARAAPVGDVARAARRLVDRFVDAIVLSAALAHSGALARSVAYAPVGFVLCALIGGAYTVETAAAEAIVRRAPAPAPGRALWRTIAALAALASRYAAYALTQSLLSRYTHVAGAAAATAARLSLATLLVETATPLALIALLVAARHAGAG